MEDIVLIGYGGHAKSVADCIDKQGKYRIVGYTDIRDNGGRLKYLGTDDDLSEIYAQGVRNAAICIGFMGLSSVRDSIVKQAKNIGFCFPVIIDPSAVIAEDTKIGEGSFIGKRAVINAAAKVGDFCIINTGAIVEHDNQVGDFSHISVGAVLCGEVLVGHHTLIGAGSTVIQCKKIGNNCIIGANSTVLCDVEDDKKVFGIVR